MVSACGSEPAAGWRGAAPGGQALGWSLLLGPCVRQGSLCAQGSHPHNKPARVVVLMPQFTDEETRAQRGKTTCPKSLNKNCLSEGHHMGR